MKKNKDSYLDTVLILEIYSCILLGTYTMLALFIFVLYKK